MRHRDRRASWSLISAVAVLVLHAASGAWAQDRPASQPGPGLKPAQAPPDPATATEPDNPAPATETEETTEAADAALTQSQAQAAYAQALEALKQQQWTQAELLLERVLMFQPEHAEALVQLATLLAQRDRLESAQALISMLLNDPRTPPAHRSRLQTLLDNSTNTSSAGAALAGIGSNVNANANDGSASAANALPAAGAPKLVARTQALFSAGYTRNPLGTTSATQLTLTLPDGPVTLPVVARAQGGGIGTVALHHQRASGLELYAQLQTSTLPQASTSGRVALGGPLGLKNHNWSLSSQRALDGSTRHSAAVVRTLPGNTQLMASVFHESSFKRTDWLVRGQRSVVVSQRWPVTAWGEYEHGRGAAPGALRAGMQALVPITPNWQLQSLVYGQWDTSGYNKLLENNAARKLLTAHVELEYRWPARQLDGQTTFSVYKAQRWSNLALFDWSDHGMRLSWLRQW